MKEDLVFFTAGHGLYHFHVGREVFNRSLYYNLLLQPFLAAPDHYFLQGNYVSAHLRKHKSRGSWLETALRNGFLIPFFRGDRASFRETLSEYWSLELKGFLTETEVEDIAERLEGTFSSERQWDPRSNSARFRRSFERLFDAWPPPEIPDHANIDPWDYLGFLERSAEWRDDDIMVARDRARDDDTLPISLLIQASADRILGRNTRNMRDVSELLGEMQRRAFPEDEIRDLRIFYTLACEYYNRTLADSLLSAANSPKWVSYVAALDLAQPDLSTHNEAVSQANEPQAVVNEIRLPKLAILRRTSGQVLLDIRASQAADLYFEALQAWKDVPSSDNQERLTAALDEYSRTICKEVGGDVDPELFVPQFMNRASGILEFLQSVPDEALLVVTAFAPNAVKVASGSILLLKYALKRLSQPSRVEVLARQREKGVIIGPDATLLRRIPEE